MLPYLTEHHGNPSSIHGRAAAPARASTRPARRSRSPWRQATRDRLHRERHRGRQPGAQGRRLGPASASGRHVITSSDRAQGRAARAADPRAPRLRGHLPAGGPIRARRPRRRGRRASPIGRRSSASCLANNEVGTIQPTGRDRRARAATRRIPSTPMPSSRPGSRPPTVDAWQASLVSLSAPQARRAEGRRGAVRAAGDADAPADPGRRARSDSAGRAPRTWPASSGSRLPCARVRRARRAVEPCATGCWPGYRATRDDADRRTRRSGCRTAHRSSFEDLEGGDLVAALDLEGIEASTGSACTTGSVDPSPRAACDGDRRAAGSWVASAHPRSETTTADVERTTEVVGACVERLRAARAMVASA